MTAKDFPGFLAGLAKLAVVNRMKMDQAVARSYFEALQEVPLEHLLPALSYLLRHGGDFMPTPSRILETVDLLLEEREHAEQFAAASGRLALDGTVETTAPAGVHCRICHDTGRRKVCPGGCADPESCPKNQHGYCAAYKDGAYSLPVTACSCAPTNPELLRKLKAARRRGPRYSRRKERTFYGRDE